MANTQMTPPPQTLDPQTQMLITVGVTFLGPLIAKSGIMSAAQFGDTLSASVNFALNYVVPAAGAFWAWYKNQRSQRILAVAATPGVAHVAMDTADGAKSVGGDNHANDNILTPKEVVASVAAQPTVSKVVMRTEDLATAIPSAAVVGPSALKAA